MPEESPVDPSHARHALVGRLTRGALHELGNPLLALIGSAELAAADAAPGTRLRERLELVSATAAEIADVVRAVQRVARVGAGEPVERIELAAEAADAAALVRRLAPARGGDLECAPGGGAWVEAPRGALLLALAGLLLDALESSPPGPVHVVVGETDGRAAAAVAGASAGSDTRALAAAAGATLEERADGVALALPSAR